MKQFFTIILLCALMAGLGLVEARAQAIPGDLQLEAQLILGSKDNSGKGAPVAPDIEKKLKRLPLKWEHYSVINTQTFGVAKDSGKTVALGEKCEFTVKNLGAERVEVTLAGRGKITQFLHKGQTLVTGGNDENSILVLRQVN